ncbi:hypothetical protein K501DRAFT_276959 [Backusella circina FSU 941]|nr:hypothetical protein K501DRAFT_276959 [Backusella circina FSU 941]
MNEADQVTLSRQSMPPQVYPYDLGSVEPSISGLDFPEYLHGQVSPSPSPRPDLLHQATKQASMPTLVSVPDAGPTAVLASSFKPGASENKFDSPKHASSEENWVASSSSPEASVPPPHTSVVSTIDPSNLMMPSNVVPTVTITPSDTKPQHTQQEDEEEPKDLYLSATTLTIGTWHRLKMHETDLVCVYRPDARIFAWHIVDGGCHFKMEVAQDAVSSIEYVMGEHDAVCDVHFDISEPPLFYMESSSSSNEDNKKKKEEIPTPMWVQCSDFTEGKQASRFFRHTLKGVALHMKQELLALINDHEETRRLVHFIEPQMFPLENEQQQLLIQAGFMNPMYWSHPPPPPTSAEAVIPCELYMS